MRAFDLKEAPIYYFAYGMLTDPSIMQGCDFIGKALLKNHQFEMLRFANIVPAAGHSVAGVLWSLNRKRLADLDRIEGYPRIYDRKTLPVYHHSKKYEACVYMLTPDSKSELWGTSPTEWYLDSLINGYSQAGISLEQIKKSLR